MRGYMFITSENGISYWAKDGKFYQRDKDFLLPLKQEDLPWPVFQIFEEKIWRSDWSDLEARAA